MNALLLGLISTLFFALNILSSQHPLRGPAVQSQRYVKAFEEIRLDDIAQVGGKNASLGQMIGELSDEGIDVPTGFAITADAYRRFLQSNNLKEKIQEILVNTLVDDLESVQSSAATIRTLLENATLPSDLEAQIVQSYEQLSYYYNQEAVDVAVRSSGTAEDLPDASFAGQQDTYLNVRGKQAVLEYCKKCFASLFTDRAIIYRAQKGYDHYSVALSIGVQKMVRSDLACSGVVFSLDTETGFSDVITINSSYGLGEAIVQGEVSPDEYLVHKPTLKQGYTPIIKKHCGSKEVKMIYADDGKQATRIVPVPEYDSCTFALSNDDIIRLAHMATTIEQHYSNRKGSWCPMDIEWAKDGIDGKMYIVQARPETVHSNKKQQSSLTTYQLMHEGSLAPLVTGQSVGQKIVSGTARIVTSLNEIGSVEEGDILITHITNPDWVPAMKKAVGIVTEQGGRTCHAAIVSRELGIAAIVGAQGATHTISSGQQITLDCSTGKIGYVYPGIVSYKTTTVHLEEMPKAPVNLMVNLADPDRAFTTSFLPVDGVGLARLEFIINNTIKIHPMALLHPEKIVDEETSKLIAQLTNAYTDKTEFFVDTLAQGIATIAAAFYPRPVIVRLSDFKSNEYRNLIGGLYFEPQEENPMIGFRGASRYYHERYREAFALECLALKRVRDLMGLTNVKAMIPFVRTLQEGRRVIEEMTLHGLVQHKNGLQVIMMCEIPSNVVLVDEFSKIFDGFSIGSNDLTQLTLGVDRDSGIMAGSFDERDLAVKKMLTWAVQGAVRNNKYSGICGQAPSDFPELADFLIDLGIQSLSLNPDCVVPFLMRLTKKE